ncbi:hypothetical protein DTO166G4_704 [Paecilomyces variotii]|nr:hypothetical protein DTO032I3_9014 [Paecilomyces variotii]KAJ9205029.1 hypothetical protein DTO164E3_1652 [Paecilomyces variotii]KAJ9217522.1 hypothetical protein DTO166G4_704 [Paecilomyces variotii]KAJ9242995.1 hypothetical protein DTO166G5_99 [Paecilomyces variotii]KAJ9274744.1 hypothetical protein DTO021D3_8404 [Paecilomyces variotii]
MGIMCRSRELPQASETAESALLPIPFSFSFTITITTSQRQTCKEICKAGPSISTDGIFSGGPVLIFAQLITNHDTMRPVGLGVSNIQRPRCHAR